MAIESEQCSFIWEVLLKADHPLDHKCRYTAGHSGETHKCRECEQEYRLPRFPKHSPIEIMDTASEPQRGVDQPINWDLSHYADQQARTLITIMSEEIRVLRLQVRELEKAMLIVLPAIGIPMKENDASTQPAKPVSTPHL